MSGMKIFAACAVAFLFLGGMLAIYGVGVSNDEIQLRNQYSAKIDANKAVHDAMWKTLQQTAGVASKYAEDFSKVYQPLMNARYGMGDGGKGGDGSLMKWIQERNPKFDSSLYARIQTVIEAKRAEFKTVQIASRDVKREHDNLILQFPSRIFVGGREALPVIMVTSTRTEETFEQGVDDNVDMFN